MSAKLLQLHEHAVRARWMDECDERAFRTPPGLVVDEPRAACPELGERRMDVVDAQRDVVNPRPALLDVLRDWRVRRGCFQQLQFRLADGYEMRPHGLGRDLLGRLDLEPQRIAIKGERGGEILYRDADVIENCFHRCRPAFRSSVVAAVYGSSSRAAMRSTIPPSSSGASTCRSR